MAGKQSCDHTHTVNYNVQALDQEIGIIVYSIHQTELHVYVAHSIILKMAKAA